MKRWVTEIKAIDPCDGELKIWCGPEVEAETEEEAENFCKNYMGYCSIKGELVDKIDASDVIGHFIKRLGLKKLVINANNLQ